MGFRKRPSPRQTGRHPQLEKLSAAQRSARAAMAGNAVLCRYGVQYYQAIGKLSRQKKLASDAAQVENSQSEA